MQRLYSINSPNGIGYNCSLIQTHEISGSKSDYYKFTFKESENSNLEFSDSETDNECEWSNSIIETEPGICDNCKIDLQNKCNQDNSKEYKLLYPNESLFIYKFRRGYDYCNVYKHYCTECLNKVLYTWSLKNPHNKYPSLRLDGSSIIYLFKSLDSSKIEYDKSIEYPRIYVCDYYISQGYNYLNFNDEKKTEKQLLAEKIIIENEKNDIVIKD